MRAEGRRPGFLQGDQSRRRLAELIAFAGAAFRPGAFDRWSGLKTVWLSRVRTDDAVYRHLCLRAQVHAELGDAKGAAKAFEAADEVFRGGGTKVGEEESKQAVRAWHEKFGTPDDPMGEKRMAQLEAEQLQAEHARMNAETRQRARRRRRPRRAGDAE